MDAGSIQQIIANLGFPIACCCYLFYSNDKLRATLEENTKAIMALKEYIMEHTNKE